MLEPVIFREYDIRGIVGETLTEEGMRLIGRAFGTRLRRSAGRTVAVGYDGRLSSPALEAALVVGLSETGCHVSRIGLGPSPMLYFATHHLGTDAGMMVTGSHNPPTYNGIKMSMGKKPFFGADIQSLNALIATSDFESGRGEVAERPVSEAYIARLAEVSAAGRPLTVAWDPGNGAAAAVLEPLCKRLPGRHVRINDTVDGTFPAHHPDPTVEENLAQLQATVVAEGCDLGIAFDGDGDRLGVVDGRGRVLWGDQVLTILATDVLRDVPGATIIADVKSSKAFFDEITRLGGRPLMSKTGHSPIKTLMMETGAMLAGEMSGHIFFAHRYLGFDDALYAAVRLIDVLSRSPSTLAEIRDGLPQMVNTPELRIDCPEERKFQVVEEVRARLANMPEVIVDAIDGVRVTTANGWWLLRASNTQPILVGRCEAEDVESLAQLKSALREQLTLSGVDTAAVA